MRLKVQASIVESLEAQLKAELSPQQKAQMQGLVSRGIKAAEIDESGHLIFTLTDNTTVDLGKVVGDKGDKGDKGDPGSSAWDNITGKPFERIGDTLKVEDGTLDVNIYETSNPQGGNTLYIGG